MIGLVERLRRGLAKTHDRLFGELTRILTRGQRLSDEALEELEAVLVAADIGIATASKIVEDIRAAKKARPELRDADIFDIAKQEIIRTLAGGASGALAVAPVPPTVVLLVGVNGTGKTTSAAKLAHHLKTGGRTVLLAACDTFRAAAIDQLKIWGARVGVDVVAGQYGADSAAVAYDALEAAVSRRVDYMLIDTAGRQHTRKNLMEEMKKLRRALQKRVPEAPHEVLLVLDGATGQNALAQAREFHSALGVTGLIVTKLDGTPKGGIVVAIAREVSIPVKFIGVGEQLDDLQPFEAAAFAEALFAG